MFNRLATCVVGIFCIVIIGMPGTSVTASPEVIQDATNQLISLDRKEPFFVYFGYGDPASTQKYPKAFIQITSTSPSITISPLNIFELQRKDPAVLACSDSTLVNEFPVDPTLIDGGVLTYGPLSAQNPNIPSGTKSAVQEPKSTGCIKIGLKVNPSAVQGQKVSISLDQGYIGADNKAILISERPKKTILMALGIQPTCASNQTAVGGICLNVCSSTQYRAVSGECITSKVECKDTQDLINNSCVAKCNSGTARTNFGDCKGGQSDATSLISTIVTILVVTVVVITSGIIVLRIRKSFTHQHPK